MILPVSADPATRPPTFTVGTDGARRPNPWADPELSGRDDGPLRWRAQWKLLQTIRTDPAFRDELREALGL